MAYQEDEIFVSFELSANDEVNFLNLDDEEANNYELGDEIENVDGRDDDELNFEFVIEDDEEKENNEMIEYNDIESESD